MAQNRLTCMCALLLPLDFVKCELGYIEWGWHLRISIIEWAILRLFGIRSR
jgi:hypothetical protein